ncbi:MAG: adenylyl-sulfate kinase, partial [Candidatus Sumerlaeia bacterium]|nr:adenylyl-sulfate kinase [Candidatus Sumerlaeia bacterium]
LIKTGTNIVSGSIAELRYSVDVNTLETNETDKLELNQVGRCHVALNRAIPFDGYTRNKATGSFIIVDRLTNSTVGAGMISDIHGAEQRRNLWDAGAADTLARKTSRVSTTERQERLAQKAVAILLTGLTASGKSLIAYELERRLFDAGRTPAILDGQIMRTGLSKDLGFSFEDRSENLRRAAEVARILVDNGMICICSFVAPSAEVRDRTRQLIGSDRFLEIHASAPVEVCRERDDKGMYERADAGEFDNFPGVSAPYETPTNPDLVLPTHEVDIPQCVDRIIKLLEERKFLV